MRDHSITEIRRLAAANAGQAPGYKAFVSATGISETKWRGKLWARWGDALIEAGFEPNEWVTRSERDVVLHGLALACRHYGRYPTEAEISLLRHSNAAIPTPKAVRTGFDDRADVLSNLATFIEANPEFADVLPLLPTVAPTRKAAIKGAKPVDGYVYLIKSGNFYKIGRSDELERRVKEIRVALPDAATLIHSITTDDPPGIEAYWHRRFADRRANGEWFKLSPDDVKAFMRRKFQ